MRLHNSLGPGRSATSSGAVGRRPYTTDRRTTTQRPRSTSHRTVPTTGLCGVAAGSDAAKSGGVGGRVADWFSLDSEPTGRGGSPAPDYTSIGNRRRRLGVNAGLADEVLFTSTNSSLTILVTRFSQCKRVRCLCSGHRDLSPCHCRPARPNGRAACRAVQHIRLAHVAEACDGGLCFADTRLVCWISDTSGRPSVQRIPSHDVDHARRVLPRISGSGLRTIRRARAWPSRTRSVQ